MNIRSKKNFLDMETLLVKCLPCLSACPGAGVDIDGWRGLKRTGG
jgi:hypothetical protein